jgi:hypothetical protein
MNAATFGTAPFNHSGRDGTDACPPFESVSHDVLPEGKVAKRASEYL